MLMIGRHSNRGAHVGGAAANSDSLPMARARRQRYAARSPQLWLTLGPLVRFAQRVVPLVIAFAPRRATRCARDQS
jgi:hypothetical protein